MIAAPTRRNSRLTASNRIGRGSDVSPTMTEDLTEIVTGCQRDDRRSQQQLYEHCRGKVLRLASRMVGAQDAPDLVQEIFLQAFRSIRQFSGRSSFETWLYRLAVNECLQFLRQSRRRATRSLDYEPLDRAPPQTTRVQENELLERGLERLDPELRSTFLLRELEGFSYGRIAEILGISEGTVGSRLNRARAELREHLGELGWDV